MQRTGSLPAASLSVALLVLALPLGSRLHAQDPAPPPPPAPAEKAQEPPAKPLPPLEALKQATPEQLPKALRAFMEDQMASNAVFAGQYSVLSDVAGSEALVLEWISRPPQGVSDRTGFRTACVRASRDLLKDKASDEVIAKLTKIAQAGFEASNLRAEAAYALAQFGKRDLVDAKIAEIEKATKSEDAAQQAEAYQQLAELRYNLREFEPATAAYESLIALVESKKVPMEEGRRATTLYNAACSYALAGNKEKAFERLQNALDAWKKSGTLNRRLIETDMDVKSLRDDPKWKELMASYLPPAVEKKAGDGASR